MLWNELETNLANINENVIIKNALNIDMNLESGDTGIKDTLYHYFKMSIDIFSSWKNI